MLGFLRVSENSNMTPKKHLKKITYVFQKYPENFAFQLLIIVLFSLKVAYFLMVSIVFSVDKQSFTAQQLKNKNGYVCENFSVYIICVEAIIYVLSHNLHYCTFKSYLVCIFGKIFCTYCSRDRKRPVR